jgi:hypothetical protein
MDFLVFGSIWSFSIGGIFLLSFVSALEDEDVNGWILALIIGVYLVGNYFFGNKDFFVNVFLWIKNNPIDVILYFIGYFMLGLIWSIARWYFFVADSLERQKYSFENRYAKTKNDKFAPTLPSYYSNKDLIALWISYWPFLILWNLTYKFFRRITIWIRNRFEKVYNSISDSLFNSYTK